MSIHNLVLDPKTGLSLSGKGQLLGCWKMFTQDTRYRESRHFAAAPITASIAANIFQDLSRNRLVILDAYAHDLRLAYVNKRDGEGTGKALSKNRGQASR